MPDLNDGDLTEERNISVVLINRYPLESIAIKTLLENKGVSVTGEAINGMDALRIVDQLQPNTIIVDVDLPDIDGIGLVETLRKRLYKGSIIVTSNKYEYFYSRCTASAGGNGFVSKKDRLILFSPLFRLRIMVILIFHFRNIGFPEKERMRGISYKPYPSRKS
ncbi:response regulator [Klebsiella pneumoniae]|uniref:response regulator n=1 Tax=Klebsiella pneumoniae TaxID=573 RepID=UPI00226ED6DB|nr:response regulator [Klebsiella pneumoniae]MCY0081289.1 response regulator [Klebsiella pneumoniae]MDZ1109514.1 response regulator [Klebsiella pneumoniae]